MSKFEQSHDRHTVHEIHKPQGHGYVDQKYGKGNLSPVHNSTPQVDSGAVPGMDGAGAPGSPMDQGPTGVGA